MFMQKGKMRQQGSWRRLLLQARGLCQDVRSGDSEKGSHYLEWRYERGEKNVMAQGFWLEPRRGWSCHQPNREDSKAMDRLSRGADEHEFRFGTLMVKCRLHIQVAVLGGKLDTYKSE